MNDYKKMDGLLVPTTAHASWRLATGDVDYANFRVLQLEYDHPARW
jgi:hypothetical protein